MDTPDINNPQDFNMLSKIVVGFIAAALALIIREMVDYIKRRSEGKKIAALFLTHLRMIQSDLAEHVELSDNKAKFTETLYCEAVVGEFLYDLITSNMNCFSDASAVGRSTEFFHTYKVNMATVKARLDTAVGGAKANLKRETYDNLLEKLDGAIEELSGLARQGVEGSGVNNVDMAGDPAA